LVPGDLPFSDVVSRRCVLLFPGRGDSLFSPRGGKSLLVSGACFPPTKVLGALLFCGPQGFNISPPLKGGVYSPLVVVPPPPLFAPQRCVIEPPKKALKWEKNVKCARPQIPKTLQAFFTAPPPNKWKSLKLVV